MNMIQFVTLTPSFDVINEEIVDKENINKVLELTRAALEAGLNVSINHVSM